MSGSLEVYDTSEYDIVSTYNKSQRFFFKLSEIRLIFIILGVNLLLLLNALKSKADIYYANDLDTLPASFLLSRIYKAKLIYDVHELYAEQFGNYSIQYTKFLIWLESIFINKADKVITVNDSISDILSQRHQIERPTVILNCPMYIDIQKYRRNARNHKVKIIYQGIYNPERGLEELILSAKHIENGLLFFRGYGTLDARLRRLVTKNGLEEKVFFLEPVRMQDLVISLQDMDVGVGAFKNLALNSYYCLPNKIFEYMMAGLTLAVSDLPELRKITEQCGNGVLFDPNNPVDIAEKINSLTNHPEELERMKANSLKWAKVYNWEGQSQKLQNICNDLLQSERQF